MSHQLPAHRFRLPRFHGARFSGLVHLHPDDGPHLVYLPECTFDAERFAADVQLSGTGALADLLCEQIKSRLGLSRVRGDTLGYLQRSFVGCASDVDQREARAAGEQAVRYAMQGAVAGSVAVQRGATGSAHYPLIPLAEVAARTRIMDDIFIAASGNDVTPAFLDYLRPLLGSGLPATARLRLPVVSRAAG